MSKWKSRRWLITVWSMILLTFVLVWAMITKTDLQWIGVLLPVLGAVPSAYIAGNSYSKRFYQGVER